jgi:acyl-CoA synthetase (AMP-forming)/AMP-acid ligase II
MARYWNRPEQTRDAFTSDGWFRTGDIGRIDEDGMLSIVDRKKDIIISGGENISSREVEDLLAGHPWVAEVAVVGVPNNQWGEMVVAAVRVRTPNDLDLGVTEAEPAPTQAELVEWAKARISGFKRPKVIVFRSEFPMNASGKVLKAVLREELREELQQGETP